MKIAKEKKRERDRSYKRKKADSIKQEEDEKGAFIKDFENILVERQSKRENFKQWKEELKNEIALASSENANVLNFVDDEDKEELSLKPKIKEIFSHHEICKLYLML